MARVSASILSFLFEAREKKESTDLMIKKINNALLDRRKDFQILQIDVMDGKFVTHKSFTPIQCRKIICPQKKEVHLMVVDYKKYIKDFLLIADMFIVHNEVITGDFSQVISFLKQNHKFVGIAINPETSITEIKYLDKIDLVLVMSVHPGVPGQKFIDGALRKIRKLREIRQKNDFRFQIEVDGGINEQTRKKCIAAGADLLVEGSYFFKGY